MGRPWLLGAKPRVDFKDGKEKVQIHQRAKIDGSVILHNDHELYIAPLENISAGGVFVGELVSLAEGNTVHVVVKSPKLGEPIQATGTVVRVENRDRSGLAVEFTRISGQHREVIQTCVFESKMERVLKVA